MSGSHVQQTFNSMTRPLGILTSLLVLVASGCGTQEPSAPTHVPAPVATPAPSAPARSVAATVQEATLAGGAVRGSITAEIGSLRPTWSVCTLPTKGSSLSLALRPVQPATSAYLLEIEEIHDRRSQAFGCSVLVNGSPVYFRSYEELAAGPNRYFVQVPRALAPDGRLEVTLRNEGYAPLSISRVWAYADFFDLAAAEGTYQPMAMYGEAQVLLPIIAPVGEAVAWDALGKAVGTPKDVQAWKDLQARLAGTGYTCGPFINLQYALQSYSESASSLDQGLERVAALGVDFQLAFNSGEWGSHPNGPDGLGGYFSDVRYSSITYEESTKTYRPCWPGTPGNTTWPAWNDLQLQRFLKHRLGRVVRHYRDQRDLLAARGVRLPYPAIDQDWGLAATIDCSDSSRAAAHRDGVDFRPEDGLNDVEKMWLYCTYSQVPKRFGAWFAEAAQRDALVVDRGELRLPERQTVDDYHFQTFADAANSPLKEHRWAGWQFATGEQTNVTGEFLPHLPAAYFDYIGAQGKLLCPNLERMALPTLEYIQTCYERGFRSLWICNARSGDAEQFAPPAKGQDDRPCSPVTAVGVKLIDLTFAGAKSAGPVEQIAASENLAPVGGSGELQAAADGKPASITYRLANDGRPFAGPLTLDLTARFAEGAGNAIEVAIGSDPATLTTVARLTATDMPASKVYPWKRHIRVALGETLRERTSGLLRLTLITAAKHDGVGIEALRVSLPWSTSSGHPGGEPFTIKQARILRLWTQDRAVLERAQARYRQLAGEDAVAHQAADLAADGRLVSAYRLLSGALSQHLPARFAVRGHGSLGSYPLSVKLTDDNQELLVDLAKVGAEGCVWSVTTAKDQGFQMTFTGLRNEQGFALSATGANAWKLAPATAVDALRPVDGRLTVTLDARRIDADRQPLPPQLTGTFLSEVPGGIMIETQAKDLWLDNPIYVPVANSAIWTRTAVGPGTVQSGHAQARDRVDLTINGGVAQAVRATFGHAVGRIRTFQPPVYQGQTSNGVLELEDGSRFELSNMWGFTQLEVPKLSWMTRFHTAAQLQKAFHPGLEVTFDYSPSTVDGLPPRLIRIKAQRPPPDPNLKPYTVFASGMTSGWFQNGWNSTIDPVSTAAIRSGTQAQAQDKAIAITITGAGGAGGVYCNGGFDLSPYRSISFSINGGSQGGQKLKLVLAEGGQSWTLPAPLAATTWVTYTVKLADIGAQDLDNLAAVRFIDLEGTSVGKTFQVDDLVFDP